MNLSDSLQKYLDDISSNSPTPGGGSVSAFSGALACSLGIMVCNLTIGKKKYLEVEDEIKELKNKLESVKVEFIDLAKKDNEAFDKVMDAFKLPKETDEQKNIRSGEIEKATLGAAVIPSKVLLACRSILPVLESISQKGNRNSVSDAGVAIALTETAAQGAFLNVLINFSSLSKKDSAKDLFQSSESILNEIKNSAQNIIHSITNNLNRS